MAEMKKKNIDMKKRGKRFNWRENRRKKRI